MSIKNQIRSIKRLLQRDAFKSDELRQGKEQELKALEGKLDQKVVVEKEKKIAKKYRVVKFYERVKLIRKLKSTRTLLLAAPEDKDLRKTEKQLLNQLKYIFLFPKGSKYISLFPKKEVDAATQTQQDALLKQAKKTLKHADEELKTQFRAYCTATQINTFSPIHIAGQTEAVPVEEAEEEEAAAAAAEEEKDDFFN